MQEQRARKILQALVEGVDPTTGVELEAGTVLQRADVLRVHSGAHSDQTMLDDLGRPTRSEGS